jgi:hypothetical protein
MAKVKSQKAKVSAGYESDISILPTGSGLLRVHHGLPVDHGIMNHGPLYPVSCILSPVPHTFQPEEPPWKSA